MAIHITSRTRSARAVGALLLLVAMAGCRDGTGPTPRLLTMEIRRNSVSSEEETIAVGATLSLTSMLLDQTRNPVDPQPKAGWSSTAPGIASVDSTGVVRGLQPGSASIIASAGGKADTVRINVANPVAAAISCAARDTLVRLTRVGEVFTTTADRAATLCLEGGTSATEYTFIPFNASAVAASRLTMELTGVGTSTAVGPPVPLRATDNGDRPGNISDIEFHSDFRERTSRALEPRLRASHGLVPTRPSLAAVPAVGDLLRLNVEARAGDGCTSQDFRTGRVVAITQKAIVVADTANPRTANPNDGLTADDYRYFGETFDTLVWRVNTENFGTPTDIDENGRVILFFTRAVNELTGQGASSYVAGFFFNRDLFRKTGTNACAGSNAAEMFYLMAPDPGGTINGNFRSKNFIRGTTVGVLAHEFQHLINDSRRLYVTKAPVWEETWLNEGLSHIAEELAFYASSGLTPGMNIGPSQLTAPRASDAFQRYNLENFERLARYLEDPTSSSLLDGDAIATRGAIWAFLRYAADRVPGSDATLWKAIVGSDTQGLANLEKSLGANPRDWMRDWTVSVYTDDAGLAMDAQYLQPSWNFRTIYPTLRDDFDLIVINRYPLLTIPIRNSRQTFVLQGGGAGFFRVAVAAGQTAAIRTTVGGLPAPSRLRIAIVRTK